ncbi:MAG: hypothetical protein DMG73_09420 [Acidobacteria bacterium]|nr:MAG: hypothetical protein DMG73_09420 [Acidobacteriota bacterium]
MKLRTRVTKGRRGKTAGRKTAGRRIANLRAAAGGSKRSPNLIAEIGELYRPIKKPVTLRLDADVLAWFKKQGRGYQTRINRALRKVMTGERKGARE